MSTSESEHIEHSAKVEDALVQENHFPFAKLPKELAWKVFNHVPGEIPALRLTSRLIKAYTDEYARQRLCIRIVNDIKVTANTQSSIYFCNITVPIEKSKLFELRLKLRKNPHSWIERRESSKYDVNYRFVTEDFRAEHESVLEYLNECMGTRVDTVELISGMFTPPDTIYKIIRGIRFDSLVFRYKVLDESSADVLLELVKENHPVDTLILEVGSVTVSDPISILRGLAASVRCIRYESRSGASDFFGMENVDLAPIIIDMFSGTLDHLAIWKGDNQDYLNLRCAKLLRERLPLLGKKIVFSATCKHYGHGMQYENNGHRIIADGEDLRIAHATRFHDDW